MRSGNEFTVSISRMVVLIVILLMGALVIGNREASADLDIECIGTHELVHERGERVVELVTHRPDDHCTGYLFASAKPIDSDGRETSAVVSGELLPNNMMRIRSELLRPMGSETVVSVNFVIQERGTLPPVVSGVK